MSGQSISQVPANPRLEFGVPVEKLCEKGTLHQGLRELFLKAYLSASGYDRAEEEELKGLSKIPYVFEALKAGPKGQGQVTDRISLKLKIESGKWIMATQTPAGAPLWLVRHFLGCLPRPLLHESHWRMIAIACGEVQNPNGNHHTVEVLEKISTALDVLPEGYYLILEALVILIRNLSTVIPTHDLVSVTLHEEAVEALSRYFIGAILSRPYRPGLYTMPDKEHKPLLVFLSEHWLEVKELCQHTGISCYHSTCDSRYEFVSPDSEVDHTMWKAMANADDIYDEIHVPESFARKSNQQLPHITKPANTHCAVESKTEARQIDAVPNVQKIENQGDSMPMTVHTPKDVYLIPRDVESICTSVADEEANRALKEGLNDTFGADHSYDSECLLCKFVVKERSENNPKFDMKKLISKYEHKPMVFAGTHQAFRCDCLPSKEEATGTVKVKINGTQTFECEFPEESEAIEVEKLKERTNYVWVSPARVEILKNDNTEQLKHEENVSAVVIIGPSNVFKLSKIRGRRAILPLTKSTALLIKNLDNDGEILYRRVSEMTRSDSVEYRNGKVVDEVKQPTTLTSKVDKDVKTFKNPSKDVNEWKEQRQNLNCNDFVTELKNNFKQGRRKPSDAKLSSRFVLADDSRQDVTKTTGQRISKVFHIAQFSSAGKLFPKTSCAPISYANSI